jgi:hypothetical protein
MTQIIYNPQIQPANKLLIERYLNKYLWLVPQWCHSVYIGLWDAKDDSLAEVKVDYCYRRASIDIYSSWLDRTEVDQEKALLHELIHIHLAIMADYARNEFNNLVSKEEAPKFNQHLQDQLAIYHESITEDLAFAIFSHLKSEN